MELTLDQVKDFLIRLMSVGIEISLKGENLEVMHEGEDIDAFYLKEIKENKKVIVEFLMNSYAGHAAAYAISVLPESASYVLSSMQYRMWLMGQITEGNIAYNIPASYVFEGHLAPDSLSFAFERLLQRHEILRTVFQEDEQGEIRQVVIKEATASGIQFTDIRHEKEQSSSLEAKIKEAYMTAFDLSSGPLLRLHLIRTADDRWVFVFVMHHIISDGWSMSILVRELLQYYKQHLSGVLTPEQPLRIQYKDYAAWQRAQLENGSLGESRTYWMAQLGGELPVLELPLDDPRPSVKTYNGGVVKHKISADALNRFESLLQAENCTLFMGLLAALNIILYRYSSQTDIIIGSPIAGRIHPELEDQLGLYVNTLAFRTRFSGEWSVQRLLKECREVLLGGYDHQAYPFDVLVEDLSVKHHLSRSVLFDVMLVLQNTQDVITVGTVADSQSGLKVSIYDEVERGTSKFDLLFNFSQGTDGLYLELEYNSNIYKYDRIERLCRQIENVLSAMPVAGGQPISKLDYLSKEEVQQLVYGFNATATVYPVNETVFDLFNRQVSLRADQTAVVFEDRSYSYGEIRRMCNDLSGTLLSRYKIGKGDKIGVHLERSIWSIVSMISVMEIGAVYVPVDTGYPAARINYILTDSSAQVLISDDVSGIDLPAGIAVMSPGTSDGISSDIFLPVLDWDDASYVIYTSGSTGQPKGVVQTHRMLYNLIRWDIDRSSLMKGGRYLLYSSFSFDMSLHDTFYVFATGGIVHLVNEALRRDFEALQAYIVSGGIQTLSMPYAALKALFSDFTAASFTGHQLVEIVTAGEQLYVNGELRKLLENNPAVHIHNFYGPSETHVVTAASYSHATDGIPEKAAIGYPVSNSYIYVLDNEGALCGIGIDGELYIGGWNLALGYLGREDLTTQRFIADPFRGAGLMYRSGDIGRWDASGSLEYMLRRDDQIKINGYRIEIGEVESAIRSNEEIDEAVVTVHTDAEGNRSLLAYYVSRSPLSGAELKNWLGKQLPAYMLPSYYIRLEQMPLTTNGKVDKRRLPAPDMTTVEKSGEYIGAGNEMEEELVHIWEDVLNRQHIGIRDNFFDLGGNSLKAARLISRIFRHWNIRLSLMDVLVNPTIAHISSLLEEPLMQQKMKNVSAALPDIGSAGAHTTYALSSSQKRLWVLSQFDEAKTAYHLPFALHFKGSLDTDAIEAAFEMLIERYDSFRTVFTVNENGEVRQTIRTADELSSGITYHQLTTDVAPVIQSLFEKEFSLSEGPLFRIDLIQTRPDEWILCFVMHHIISDAWSIDILKKELLTLYRNNAQGMDTPLPDLKVQYKDYAAWEQQLLTDGNLNKGKDYWTNKLSGELPVLRLHGDKLRPHTKTFSGNTITEEIDVASLAEFKTILKQERCTLFMGLYTLLNVLLYRYTGQEDILIGTPVSGRYHPDLENQLGYFVNTLPLRMNFQENESFRELLRSGRDVVLEAHDNQMFPLDELLNIIPFQRDNSRNPLFDVFVVLNEDTADLSSWNENAGGLTVAAYESGIMPYSKFDLSFNFTRSGESVYVSLEYNTDIYSGATAKQLLSHFNSLLDAIVKDAGQPVKQLDYLSSQEKDTLLYTFNETDRSLSIEDAVHVLFEKQVMLTPDAIAITYQNQTITYQEANIAANRFAYFLISEYNVMPGDKVAIQLERSHLIPLSIIAILKTGAAYVPVDPEHPAERVEYILNDSACRIVVNETLIARFWSLADTYPADNLSLKIDSPALIYVMYTSGSTGRPKGCMLEHKGIVNRLAWMWHHYGFTERDVILQKTSYTFDVSVWELLMPLCWGARMVICNKEDVLSPEKLLALIDRESITTLHFVPTLLDVFLSSIPADNLYQGTRKVSRLFTSGEALSVHASVQWHTITGIPLYNLYGPTEASIDVTYYHTTPFDTGIPIGKPIWNTRIHILDTDKALVPVGVAGEICISSIGLARGYINLPDQTAASFVSNPFSAGEKMYRTGDLGRWLPDGNIEFLGRLDSQIKLRGLRIETDEVNHVIRTFAPQIKAVVTDVRTVGSTQALVAYIEVDEAPGKAALRTYLSARLPAYMIPASYIFLQKLPLTASGKIDRKRLPVVEDDSISPSPFIEPETTTEYLLADIWKEILGIKAVGAGDNFFSLGGNSLSAVRMITKVNQAVGMDIPLITAFRFPDLRSLAAYIGEYNPIPEQIENDDEAFDIMKSTIDFVNHDNHAE
jgi:amino acid adenylation domain-containing protein